jgi:hypothetical protein
LKEGLSLKLLWLCFLQLSCAREFLLEQLNRRHIGLRVLCRVQICNRFLVFLRILRVVLDLVKKCIFVFFLIFLGKCSICLITEFFMSSDCFFDKVIKLIV